jgi:hypothetical protein
VPIAIVLHIASFRLLARQPESPAVMAGLSR